jgi:hypothetical protein
MLWLVFTSKIEIQKIYILAYLGTSTDVMIL